MNRRKLSPLVEVHVLDGARPEQRSSAEDQVTKVAKFRDCVTEWRLDQVDLQLTQSPKQLLNPLDIANNAIMIPMRLLLAKPLESRSLHHASRPILRQRPFTNLRTASTSSNPTSNRAKNLILGSTGVVLVSLGYLYLTDTRASVHKYTVPPLIRWLYPDAEDAHKAGVSAMKELYSMGLHPRERGIQDDGLEVNVFGTRLTNPIGISGGLDKHAEIPDALFALGASIVEIGGITPHPQDGNPQPRVFRIPSEEALINRYGLPSEGADIVAMRLRQRVREYAYAAGLGIDQEAERLVLDGYAGVPPGSLHSGRLLAVQIAKNKATSDSDIHALVEDHVYCVKELGPYADIIVVNVSSPNTPGLRALQERGPLTRILTAVVETAKAVPRKNPPAVMVKVSPDEDSAQQIQGICDAVWSSGVDGVIVGNTTKLRPELSMKDQSMPSTDSLTLREQGGYSGPQLFERTISLIAKYRRTLDRGPSPESESTENAETKLAKSLPLEPKVIFASGGITNGDQAIQALNAGASVAMMYTALVYGGIGTICTMKDEMKARLTVKT
jgi:dihydroorotate dehydrogenase